MQRLDISILKLSGDAVLAGRDEGEAMRERMLAGTGSQEAALLVVADFAGISLATASFLDEVTLKLRPILRKRFAYPLVANMAPRVAEEFESLLARAGDAFLVGKLGTDGSISDTRIAGRLDIKLRETYDSVRAKSLASAVELFNAYIGTEKVGPTAWNNRLSALAEKGLLQEIPSGREKKFRPIMEAV